MKIKHIGELIEFSSPSFPRHPRDAELVNADTMFGFALANYIGERLPQYGMQVARFVGEDWGWYCEIDNPEFNLWYGVNALDEEDFLVQFHPGKPVIRKFLRRIDVSERVTALQAAVFAILNNEPSKKGGPAWTA